MTDPVVPGGVPGDERQARLERLQQRRAARPDAGSPSAAVSAPSVTAPARPAGRPRRVRPAEGGRIVATGVGVTVMLGTVAAMGVLQARQASADDAPADEPAAETLESVVVTTTEPAPTTTSSLVPVTLVAQPPAADGQPAVTARSTWSGQTESGGTTAAPAPATAAPAPNTPTATAPPATAAPPPPTAAPRPTPTTAKTSGSR